LSGRFGFSLGQQDGERLRQRARVFSCGNRTFVALDSGFRVFHDRERYAPHAFIIVSRPRLRLNLVRPIPLLRQHALHQRIRKGIHMPARFPHGGVHQNRAIEADDVVAHLRHAFPPVVLQVALQLHAERAVIPRAVEAAIDFRRLEDEAAPFAQGDDVLHLFDCEGICHKGGNHLGKGRAGAREIGEGRFARRTTKG